MTAEFAAGHITEKIYYDRNSTTTTTGLAGLGPTICSDRGGSISEQPLVFFGAARWPQDQCPVRYRCAILRALDANCAGAGCERRGIGARPCGDGSRCRRRAI